MIQKLSLSASVNVYVKTIVIGLSVKSTIGLALAKMSKPDECSQALLINCSIETVQHMRAVSIEWLLQ